MAEGTPSKSAAEQAPADALTIRRVLAGTDGGLGLLAQRIAEIAAEVRGLTTAEGLLLSYLAHQAQVPDKRLTGLLATFETAVELGHNIWPAQVRELVAGQDVLDFGCGNTFYGVVFRAVGAKSYLGVDQELDLHTKRYRSRRNKGYQKVRLSVADAIAHVPNIGYEQCRGIDFSEKFDVVLMHTVTEHLMDIDGTFASLRRALRSNGVIWFLHDNFYSWAGHHGEPSSRAGFDPNNAEHQRLADWAHLDESGGRNGDYWRERGLNRIRLDELREATERHFVIESWQEVAVSSKYRDRLSPEIRATRGSGCSDRELLTQHVICRGRKQAP
jgi:SAM-dependent methyltransferase